MTKEELNVRGKEVERIRFVATSQLEQAIRTEAAMADLEGSTVTEVCDVLREAHRQVEKVTGARKRALLDAR